MNAKATNTRARTKRKAYYPDRYKRTARMVVYALTLKDEATWWELSALFSIHLTEKERAALGFSVLNSLEPHQAQLTSEAVLGGNGPPLPPLTTSAEEAASWASWVDYRDVKACTLAGFNRLSANDQTEFLTHVQRRAA